MNKTKTLTLLKKYILYLFRWQLSTPILAVVMSHFAYLGYWYAVIIGNFIGGLVFFWVDKWIFKGGDNNSTDKI